MPGDETTNEQPGTQVPGQENNAAGAAAPGANESVTNQPVTDTTDTSGNGDGGKAGEGQTTTTDEVYKDFVVPEGLKLDDAVLAEAAPLFKELGLTKEQAQKLVDFQAKQVQATSQKQVDAFNQQLNDWQNQAKVDKEFGGDKFDENLALATNAMNKLGTPELKQMMNEYGMGNHPEIIRFMYRVGKLMTEDVPGNATATKSTSGDWADQLYPKTE